MSMNMTKAERDAYLAEVHVGVIAIEVPGQSPIAAPIWYDYAPDEGLWIITSATSKKGMALEQAGRFTLVAQTETAPLYKYVSVSGKVVDTRPAEIERDLKPMAHRYFDAATAEAYLKSTSGEVSTVYLMQPDTWLTLDYSKMGG